MRRLTEKQRAKFFTVRAMMDKIVAAIPMSSESEFNASAAAINENAAAIRVWIAGRSYKRGDIRVDLADGVPYWSMHDHASVEGAELAPSLTPTIWVHCHGTTVETARPFVAEGHNPYMTGHTCTEGSVVARCMMDNIVYPPSVLPGAWELVSE